MPLSLENPPWTIPAPRSRPRPGPVEGRKHGRPGLRRSPGGLPGRGAALTLATEGRRSRPRVQSEPSRFPAPQVNCNDVAALREPGFSQI